MKTPVTDNRSNTDRGADKISDDRHGGNQPGSKESGIERDLPGISERPDAIVIIYDGDCQFCQKQVKRLHRWDSRQRLAFVSLHDSIVATRYPDLSHDQLMQQMYAIDQQGTRYGGAAAFRFLTRKLPRLWLLAPILHIPFSLPFWQWAYRRVAARRYLWNRPTEQCDDGSCQVHFRK